MKKILIARLWDRFIFLVNEYMVKNGLNQAQVAERVDMQRSHLCALLNKDEKRKLSAYYLFKFIKQGIIKVDQIYDAGEVEVREVDFWKQACEAENLGLLSLIAKLRERGIDVEGFLRQMYPEL